MWEVGQTRHAQTVCHILASSSLRWVPANAGSSRRMKCGVWRVDLGRLLMLASWRWPKGMEIRSSGAQKQPEGKGMRNSSARNVLEEVKTGMKARHHCSVAYKGLSSHCVLPFHMTDPAFAGIWRDSHQNEQAHLNCCLLVFVTHE